jgi:hypothetical protein
MAAAVVRALALLAGPVVAAPAAARAFKGNAKANRVLGTGAADV